MKGTGSVCVCQWCLCTFHRARLLLRSAPIFRNWLCVCGCTCTVTSNSCFNSSCWVWKWITVSDNKSAQGAMNVWSVLISRSRRAHSAERTHRKTKTMRGKRGGVGGVGDRKWAQTRRGRVSKERNNTGGVFGRKERVKFPLISPRLSMLKPRRVWEKP